MKRRVRVEVDAALPREGFDRLDVTAHRFVARHAPIGEPGAMLEAAEEVEAAERSRRRVAVAGLSEQAVEFELQGAGRLRRTVG